MLSPEEQELLAAIEAEEAQGQGRKPADTEMIQNMLSPEEQEQLLALEAVEQEEMIQPKSFFQNVADSAQIQLESAGNALSAGYLPQLQAGFEKVNNFIASPTGDVDEKLKAQGFKLPEEKSYVQMRDENIKRQEAQAERNPYAAAAGTVAGIATTLPVAGASNLISKGVGGFSRLMNSAATGGAFSALANPGDVEGVVNPVQLAERSSNAYKGGALGAAGQTGGEAIAKIGETVKKAPGSLEKLAKIKAFKAAGAMLKDFRAARGDKAAEEIGETLLSKNIVKAGDGIEDIAAKTSAAKNEAGQTIRGVYGKVRDHINNLAADTSPQGIKAQSLIQKTALSGDEAALRVETRLSKFQKNNLGNTEVKGKMDEVLTDLKALGPDADISDWLAARNSLDDRINYSKKMGELPLLQQQLQATRDEMTKMLQNRVRTLGKVVKDPELITTLRQANKEYGQLATVERFATDRVARDNANRFFSLGDRISSGAGATIGVASGNSPEERIKNGLIGFVGGRVAAKYGRHSTAMAAKGAQTLGKALQKPANFAKYGEPLIEAAKRSPEELQALIQQFAQDPKFQKLSTQGTP